MFYYWYIFSVSLLCIVQQINSNSYDITFASYHSYAPSYHNVTKVETVINSDDQIYHNDEISADKVKLTEHTFQIYDNYQQQAKRHRRSYNTSTLPQNRTSNSTGRMDSFKTHEIYSNNLVNARNNLTRNSNSIVKNNSAHYNNFNNNTLQRRRQEGMFLNTTAPVSNRRSIYFNKDVLNNSLSWRNYLINFVNISSNRIYNYTNNQLDNHSLINKTTNSNRWFRRKRSQSNHNYNLLNYKFNEKLTKFQRINEKYFKIKHLQKRQLKDNINSDPNSGQTLTILKKISTLKETTDQVENKKLKIHRILKHDEVENVKPLLQFTTLSTINGPHDDTVMIQVPLRRTYCVPPKRLAHGRCRDVW